jgi:hypothetical protein
VVHHHHHHHPGPGLQQQQQQQQQGVNTAVTAVWPQGERVHVPSGSRCHFCPELNVDTQVSWSKSGDSRLPPRGCLVRHTASGAYTTGGRLA